LEARTENCYIYGKGCEAGTYGDSSWRSLFPMFPAAHFFYDGFEFSNQLSDDAKQLLYNYLIPYSDNCNTLWESAQVDLEELPFYKELCLTCPKAEDKTPKCSNSFPWVFHAKYQMKADALCSIKDKYPDPGCEKCRKNPLKRTKIARGHRKNENNRKAMVVSDLRLGGHAVKIKIDFVYYRCPYIENAIKTLPFLYGDSIDRIRISKRLANAIGESLLGQVRLKFISEACAIPLGTVKAWRQRDMFNSKHNVESSMASKLFHNDSPWRLPVSFPKNSFAYVIAQHHSEEPALSRLYHKEEWDSIRRFINTKSFHFSNQQISYPHLFLLAFDCLASLKCEDLPTVRALLICMKYAAETNSFDRFLSFVEECGAKYCFSDIQTFLSCVNMTYESGSPEFYRQLALYGLVAGRSRKRKTPASPQKDTVKNWWDLFREDAAPFYSQFYSSKLDRKTKLLLLEIDQQAMCSEYSVDETADLLAYYNPMLLIQNYVCPEEVRFPHLESGGIDFSAVSPKGVPLTMLERMLRAGYLLKDSDQTIWRRMAELS